MTAFCSSSSTAGLDVGDRYVHFCLIDESGEIIEDGRFRTTPKALRSFFVARTPSRVILEVGTHSPWIAREVERLGNEVLVANARRLRMIYASDFKSDRTDAETLARVGRLDPKLLAPIRHRGMKAQADLAQLRSRTCLVRSRTKLINHVRGAVKSLGGRLPRCTAPAFSKKVRSHVPADLETAISPLLDTIEELTQRIGRIERGLERLANERYPETHLLRQVPGVGPLTSLCFVLTLEDPDRFSTSRQVGVYLGLTPKRQDSGETSPQLRITRRGDRMLRSLLVGSAQYILGPFGPECDLRAWGLRLAERGGRNAKKRAVVAVARKLACVLHSLWLSGAVYEPRRMQAG